MSSSKLQTFNLLQAPLLPTGVAMYRNSISIKIILGTVFLTNPSTSFIVHRFVDAEL